MKSKPWMWVIFAILLAVGIGAIVFHSTMGFSSSIRFEGASYPLESLYAPPAYSWIRDLSGKLGQAFLSQYSHLNRIFFSIDNQLLGVVSRGGPIDVKCQLYELPGEPEHIMLTAPPLPHSAYWGAAVCQKKYCERSAWTQTKDLLGEVVSDPDVPLAHIAGQMFAATQDNLDGITAVIGKGRQPGPFRLVFHLISMDDRENDLYTEEIGIEDIPNDRLVNFKFEPIEDSEFRKYAFYFTSPDATPETAPRLMATNTNIERNGTAWLNYRSQQFDLVFRQHYSTPPVEHLVVPPGVILLQMSDIDINDCEVVRDGIPKYLGSEGSSQNALFEFTPISGSSNSYYMLIIQINGFSTPCQRFRTQHSPGTLLETVHHVVNTLMIDKPPCVKKWHIVVLVCLLFFLLAVFVHWLGLPHSLKVSNRASRGRSERGDGDSVANSSFQADEYKR